MKEWKGESCEDYQDGKYIGQTHTSKPAGSYSHRRDAVVFGRLYNLTELEIEWYNTVSEGDNEVFNASVLMWLPSFSSKP